MENFKSEITVLPIMGKMTMFISDRELVDRDGTTFNNALARFKPRKIFILDTSAVSDIAVKRLPKTYSIANNNVHVHVATVMPPGLYKASEGLADLHSNFVSYIISKLVTELSTFRIVVFRVEDSKEWCTCSMMINAYTGELDIPVWLRGSADIIYLPATDTYIEWADTFEMPSIDSMRELTEKELNEFFGPVVRIG